MKKYSMLLLGFLILQTSGGLFRIGFDDAAIVRYENGVVIRLKEPEIKPESAGITDGYNLKKDSLGNAPVKDATLTIEFNGEED
ncbi:MAG: hypothetical protein R2941_24335 [Desulfobacterales bacterium]